MRQLVLWKTLFLVSSLVVVLGIKLGRQSEIDSQEYDEDMRIIDQKNKPIKNKLINTLEIEENNDNSLLIDREMQMLHQFVQIKQDEEEVSVSDTSSEPTSEGGESEAPPVSDEATDDGSEGAEDTENSQREAAPEEAGDGQSEGEAGETVNEEEGKAKKPKKEEEKKPLKVKYKATGGKQTVIDIKGSKSNKLIQTEDGEMYLSRFDPITGTRQIMNMNKISEIDFVSSRIELREGVAEEQIQEGQDVVEKYSAPSYEAFEWNYVISEGQQPHSRGGHTLQVIGMQLVLFGGCYLDINCFNELIFFDIMEQTWIIPKVLGDPPSPRGGHSATLVGSYMYIFGGSSDKGILSDLHRINLEDRIWEQLEFEGEKPPGRTNHKSVLDNSGRIVFFGGYTDQGYSNEVYFLDLVNMRWTKPMINGDPPKPRENFSIQLVRDSYIWIFGGYALGGEVNDLWQLDAENMKWTRLFQDFGTKPVERQGHEMLLHGNMIYTIGGCNYKLETCFNDIYSLNVEDLTWTKIDFPKGNELEKRENYGISLMGTQLYLFGGCKMMSQCFDDFRAMNITDACPKNCSNRGTCRNDRCTCIEGFSGEQCEIEIKCQYNCSNRGRCRSNGKCLCYPGFTGSLCEIYVPCPQNCTSIDNGICLTSGKCNCSDGYSGDSCEMGIKGLIKIDVKCLKNCSGHGKCNEETGICTCDPGFGDLDCSITEQQAKEKWQKKITEQKEAKRLEEQKKAEKEGKGKKGDEKDEAHGDGDKPDDTSKNSEGTDKAEEQSDDDENGEGQGESLGAVESANPDTESTPTDDAEAAPADSEAAAGETEAPPADSEAVAGDTEAPPADSEAAPAVGQVAIGEAIAEFINSKMTSKIREEKFDDISTCENSCSFNGICKEEKCYCRQGLTGDDCSAETIADLHRGQKVIYLFFAVPIFFIIGLVLGYFYAKKLQEKQANEEFGKINDYENLEIKKTEIKQDANVKQGEIVIKKCVEDDSESDSFISEKIDNENESQGSIGSQGEKKRKPKKNTDESQLDVSKNNVSQIQDQDESFNIFAKKGTLPKAPQPEQ